MALDAANLNSEAAEAAHRGASLGSRIVKLRTERGWTQRELARRAGLRPARLSTLESGTKRPNLEELARLAEVLDSRMDELWSGERTSPLERDPLREDDAMDTTTEIRSAIDCVLEDRIDPALKALRAAAAAGLPEEESR